ncbi:MAG: aminotransferase class IV [bacterium]
MYPFVESIKAKNGELFNMTYHNRRFNRTRSGIFGIEAAMNLESIIPAEKSRGGLYKCRVIYLEEIIEIEFQPYYKKSVNTLRVVHDNIIDYTYKSADRKLLNLLLARKENADDIIIVKNNLVTDSFSANLVFWNGEEWHTPERPLLRGTKREKLLDERIIKEKNIGVEDILNYQKVSLINAMIDLEEIIVPIERVRY